MVPEVSSALLLSLFIYPDPDNSCSSSKDWRLRSLHWTFPNLHERNTNMLVNSSHNRFASRHTCSPHQPVQQVPGSHQANISCAENRPVMIIHTKATSITPVTGNLYCEGVIIHILLAQHHTYQAYKVPWFYRRLLLHIRQTSHGHIYCGCYASMLVT